MSGTDASHATLRRDQSLDEQEQELREAIRRTPAEPRLRIHLAQLSMIRANWVRAVEQLQLAAKLDPAALPMAQVYREAIRCELVREEVMQGRRAPTVFEDSPPWLLQLVESLAIRALGDAERADALRERAFAEAPATPFAVDGNREDWLADADTRLGPVCEVLLDGDYCWVPFQDIERIALEPPTDLRDLVWIPANLLLGAGDERSVLLPVRYPGTGACQEDPLVLGAMTEWQEVSTGTWLGLGQRLWTGADREYPMLDVRLIERVRD